MPRSPSPSHLQGALLLSDTQGCSLLAACTRACAQPQPTAHAPAQGWRCIFGDAGEALTPSGEHPPLLVLFSSALSKPSSDPEGFSVTEPWGRMFRYHLHAVGGKAEGPAVMWPLYSLILVCLITMEGNKKPWQRVVTH